MYKYYCINDKEYYILYYNSDSDKAEADTTESLTDYNS